MEEIIKIANELRSVGLDVRKPLNIINERFVYPQYRYPDKKEYATFKEIINKHGYSILTEDDNLIIAKKGIDRLIFHKEINLNKPYNF